MGGFQTTTIFAARGAPSCSSPTSSRAARPPRQWSGTSAAKCSAGLAMVALHVMNVGGRAPWCAHTRTSRRTTPATCAPNAPRYVWASSTTMKRSAESSRLHWRWFGSTVT